jgi:type I restriction enzyme S subunit
MTSEIKQRIEQVRRGEVPEGYKKGKLGVVPEEWEETSFSTLFTSTSDYTDDLEKYPLYSLTIEDGITPKTERYERSHLVKKEDSYKIVRPNDYAYNPMNLRFGAVARHKGDMPVAVSGYYDIFTTVHESDLPFMDSFLTCDPMITYYNRVSTGSLVEKQRVHFSQFLEFMLPLPSINERTKIAAILTTQDKVIELKEKRLAEKQRQKKYITQQLLTGKKRLPGFSEQWKKVKLGDICVVNPPKEENYPDIVAFLGMADISENGSIITEHKKNYESVKTGFAPFKRGDILIAKITPCFENGKGALTDKCSSVYGFGSTEFHVLRCKTVNSKFLYYHTRTEFFRKRLEAEMVGSAGQKRVQANSIINYAILLPPPIEQTAIAEVLSAADREIDLLRQDIEQEKQKKKALMQLLLTGIVRVKT